MLGFELGNLVFVVAVNGNTTRAMKLRGLLTVIKLYGTSIMLLQLLHLVLF